MTSGKIKVIFLGTNGWYDTATGNTICVLIETAKEYVVLDAGNGLYKLDRYIKDDKPIYLFLSHLHLDHIIGLHILAKFKFRQGMKICIRKGDQKKLKAFLRKEYTAPLEQLPIKVDIIGFSAANKPKFLLKTLGLRHPVPCLGFRFCFNGKIISYIADTGPCANAFELAKGADLIISECAFKIGHKFSQWPHLDPRSAAQIASKAGARRLALVHFDAGIYKTLSERKQAAKLARKIFANTSAAEDGMILKV